MVLKKFKTCVLCAMVSGGLLFLLPAVSFAEEADPYVFEQVVVTANLMPTKAAETAANVTVITKEEIASGNYSDLGDVLRGVTGVTVTSKAFPGAAQSLRINGEDRVLIMIDGRKISRPEGASNYHANFDLSDIVSLDNIERIEIVKGGASALYGSDAVGGVVNIITKKGGENRTALRTSIGSWGERNYGLSLEGTDKNWSWYVTADKRTQDDVYYSALDGSGTKAWPNSRYDGKNVTFRLDNTIDENKSFTLNFEHWNSNSGQPYSLSLQSSDIASHLWNNLALTYGFNQKSAVPGQIRLYSNYYSQYFQGVYNSRTTGAEYRTGWNLDGKNTLALGAVWEKGEVTEGSGGYSNKDVTDAAIYVQDVYKLDSKWTLTPGLRYDHYSSFGGQTTPKVNLNYSADSNTDVYVSYNKVFRAPNLDDLYYRNDTWFSYGNPDLKPEKGRVVTVGVNKKLSNSTTVSASYFNSDITDAIDWFWDPVTFVSQAVNIAREKKHGFEITSMHQFSKKYFAQIGYSYLYVERDDSGGAGYYPLYNGQPNGYRFKAGYKDDRWNWQTELIGATGRSNYYSESSYWVWNASANCKFNKETSAFFKINNIANKAYELNPDGNPASIYTVFGDYPMPARSYQFGLQVQL